MAQEMNAHTDTQTIDDEGLIDVTEIASEAGIGVPVAVSRAAWERCIAVPDWTRAARWEYARLWMIARDCFRSLCSKGEDCDGGPYLFETILPGRGGAEAVRLMAVLGPGGGWFCLTILLPEEL